MNSDTKFKGDLRRAFDTLRRFLLPYWKSLTLVILINVTVGVLVSLRPLLLAPALNVFDKKQVSAANQLSDLTLNNIGPTLMNIFGMDSENIMELGVLIALLLIIATVIIAVLSSIGTLQIVKTRAYVVRDMTIELYRHTLTLSMSFFHRQKTGDIVSRITQDVQKTGKSLDKIVEIFLKSFVQVLITLTILFKSDALFTSMILGIGLLHLVTSRLLGNRVKKRSYSVAEIRGDIGANLFEAIDGIKTVKMFAAERYSAKHTLKKAQHLTDTTIKASMLTFIQGPIRMIIDACMASAVLVMVFYAISEERMTLTSAALFFYLAQQLTKPLSDLFSQWVSVKNMLGAAERIFEIFAIENEIQDGVRDVVGLRNSIVLRDVSFTYQDGAEAIEKFNCEIRKGEFVGLVGPSGSGKTTLIDLILRLHDCTSGSVYFDGINIKEFRQREYRKQFGIVAQDNILFNATVRDNIVFNRPLDESALEHSLWVSNSNEFVGELNYGVDTILGDRGVRLSGGQRQRMAIARAIYGMPSILILDEATSALDSESERKVQEAIDRVSKEITTIVIAHRLSTIRHADKIIVLNRGQVEAIGTHMELLAASRTYRRLVELQDENAAVTESLS